MKLLQSVKTDCPGIDHMDFTADGRYAIATCEFNGRLIKLDLETRAVTGTLVLDPTAGRGGGAKPDKEA